VLTAWDDFQRDPYELLFSGSGWVWQGGLIGGIVAVIVKSRSLGCRSATSPTSPGRRSPSGKRSAGSAASSPATATTGSRPTCPGG
jgi:hypothetical protein